MLEMCGFTYLRIQPMNRFIEGSFLIVHGLTYCITLARELPAKKEKMSLNNSVENLI